MARTARKKAGVPILVQMLCICLATAGIVSVAVPCYLLPLIERELMAFKKEEIRTVVEAAHSVVSAYHQRELSGELDEKRAKQLALERVATMRYGRHGYFWVNDVRPVMLMHPVNRELNGRSLSE